MKKICRAVGLWLFFFVAILVTAFTVDEFKNLSDACYQAQVDAVSFIFVLVSINLAGPVAMDFFRHFCAASNLGLYCVLVKIAAVFLPPFYVLAVCVMMMKEQKHCGVFNLDRGEAEFGMRFLQTVMLGFLLLVPFYYDFAPILPSHRARSESHAGMLNS